MFTIKIKLPVFFLGLLCTHLLIQQSGLAEGRAAASSDDDDDEDDMDGFVWDVVAKDPEPQPPPAAAPPSVGTNFASNNGTPGHQHDVSSQQDAKENKGTPLANHGGYNDSCTMDGVKQCNKAQDLVCNATSLRCICDPSNNFIFARSQGNCVTISAKITDYSCSIDEQCQEGTFGPYSKCNPNTKRCECVEKNGNQEIIKYNDRCYIRKQVGSYCKENDECQASISGKSICIYKPPEDNGDIGNPVIPGNATKQCRCDEGYVYNNVTDGNTESKWQCLVKGKDESSSCEVDVQCTAALGPLSRCYEKTCQCSDVVSRKGEAVFYKGKCYIRLGLGDGCEADVQCQAGIHENAVCANHESYLEHDKVCTCPEGKKCDGNGAGSVLVSLNLFLIGFTATRIAA